MLKKVNGKRLGIQESDCLEKQTNSEHMSKTMQDTEQQTVGHGQKPTSAGNEKQIRRESKDTIMQIQYAKKQAGASLGQKQTTQYYPTNGSS